MPLHIVRNDITLMHVDAIVNSTNEWLIPGGTGVDAGIHAAAGQELGKELRNIFHCETGDAVLTASYNITTCRYIIHAVSPVYRGGTNGEETLLKQCYERIFSLAEEKECGSIAMPVLCSGANGYPRKEAYRIAAEAARKYLAGCEDEMRIYLVVFSREMTAVSLDEDGTIPQYITDEYGDYKRKELYDEIFYARAESVGAVYDDADVGIPSMAPCSANLPALKESRKPLWKKEKKKEKAKETEEKTSVSAVEEPDYRTVDLSFGHMCDWWMDRKHISISDFYLRANITKGTFYNLRNKKGIVPKKKIALACVIGLQLSIDEANDLLGRAGLTFSRYYETDRIVKQCMEKGIYNIDDINWILMEEIPDGETLGSGTYDKVEKAG